MLFFVLPWYLAQFKSTIGAGVEVEVEGGVTVDVGDDAGKARTVESAAKVTAISFGVKATDFYSIIP